jgi:hypothetical protein
VSCPVKATYPWCFLSASADAEHQDDSEHNHFTRCLLQPSVMHAPHRAMHTDGFLISSDTAGSSSFLHVVGTPLMQAHRFRQVRLNYTSNVVPVLQYRYSPCLSKNLSRGSNLLCPMTSTMSMKECDRRNSVKTVTRRVMIDVHENMNSQREWK